MHSSPKTDGRVKTNGQDVTMRSQILKKKKNYKQEQVSHCFCAFKSLIFRDRKSLRHYSKRFRAGEILTYYLDGHNLKLL